MYSCSECGRNYQKWVGKCLECNSWSIEELKVEAASLTAQKIDSFEHEEIRFLSGIEELDKTLGNGLVPGSVVLLTGSPGVGKSTLLLQAMSAYSKKNKVLYASAEESEYQIKGRAARVKAKLDIVASNNLNSILSVAQKYEIIAIDSIQTVSSTESAMLGSISQIRENILKIIDIAKSKNIAFFVVGHINKEGSIAGPKILEHMVDTVLDFEGEKDFHYRILRASKNRFGSINEIGVFQMTSTGIEEVKNPSEFFINSESSEGSVISPIIEGNRVFLIEVQALTTNALFNAPRRVAKGLSNSLVQIISAVVERYLKINLFDKDIFFNIPGGLHTKDPSISLAIVLAIYSSFHSINLKSAALGEVGLTGEVRKVSFAEKRIKELVKLGFKRIFIPYANLKDVKQNNIEIIGIKNIADILNIICTK